MLDLRIIAHGSAMPVFDLPALLGRAEAAKEVGDQIEALIAFMDDLAGDPDLEDTDEDRDVAEESDQSWPEGEVARAKLRANAFLEDAEQDDEAEEDDDDSCSAGDDGCNPITDYLGNIVWGSPEQDADRADGAWAETDEGAQSAYLRVDEESPEDDGQHVRGEYRDRIRRTRCTKRLEGAYTFWRLTNGRTGIIRGAA